MKKHEFNPPHRHSGLYTFVVFMKIPTHWKEQHCLPIRRDETKVKKTEMGSRAWNQASDFQFIYGVGASGSLIATSQNLPLSSGDEGRMLFFPAWLMHQVLPFYECEEERITISGNIIRGENTNLSFEEESYQFGDGIEKKTGLRVEKKTFPV